MLVRRLLGFVLLTAAIAAQLPVPAPAPGPTEGMVPAGKGEPAGKNEAPAGKGEPPGKGEPAGKEVPTGKSASSSQIGPVRTPTAEEAHRWFPAAVQTMEMTGESEVVGVFPFANPNAEPTEWRDFSASCACAKCSIVVADRTYELKPKPRELVQLVAVDGKVQRVPVELVTVGVGESGELRVHVTVHANTPRKSVSVDVHMSDPKTPTARVRLDISGTDPVAVAPQSVELGSLPPGSSREFVVTLTSPLQGNFSILDADLPPGVTATWSRVGTGSATIWRVNGTFTAKTERVTGGVMKFRTDIAAARVVSVPVHAKVEALVEVAPGFVPLGTIHLGTKAIAAIRFIPHDGSDLQITALRLEKVNIADGLVTVHSHRDGDVLVIELEVDAAAPRGLVRGDVVVELNHPTLKSQRVQFNGFVR